MVRELGRGEVLKTSPFFGREIGQYHVQTVNFGASKKAPSIAETCIFVSDKISHRKEQPGRLGTEEKIPRPSHEMFACKHF
jgi:hypothetical protein